MKIKITSCESPGHWYWDKIGQVFQVDKFEPEDKEKG